MVHRLQQAAAQQAARQSGALPASQPATRSRAKHAGKLEMLTLLRALLGERGVQRLPLLLRQEGGRGAVHRVAGLPHAAAAGAERLNTLRHGGGAGASVPGQRQPQRGRWHGRRPSRLAGRWRSPMAAAQLQSRAAQLGGKLAEGLQAGRAVGCRRRGNRAPGGLLHVAHVSGGHGWGVGPCRAACDVQARCGAAMAGSGPLPTAPRHMDAPLPDPVAAWRAAKRSGGRLGASLASLCTGDGTCALVQLQA